MSNGTIFQEGIFVGCIIISRRRLG